DGARGDDLPGPQADPAEAVAGDLHACDLALDEADAAGRELPGPFRSGPGGGVEEQGDVGAPLPPHERLRGGVRTGGQDREWLVAQFPAEAERAVHDVAAPAFPQAGEVGVFVDEAGGG